MPSFIPRSDADFDAFAANAVTKILSDLAGYGLVAGDLTPVTTAKTAWDTDFPDSVSQKAAAQAAVALKDVSRAAYEAALRVVFGKIYANGVAGPDQLADAGMPEHDTIPTPVPVPTTRPVLLLGTSARFQHKVNYTDEGTPTQTARPFGVAGCELRLFVGPTPPVDPLDSTFVCIDAVTPRIFEFAPAQAGSMAHWTARWINTRGEPGPWSDVVSAVIPG
jgi:hypothetical protein